MAIILIFLALADSLSSLKLVSVTTGLILLTLMIDVYGSTSIHDEFWKCTVRIFGVHVSSFERNNESRDMSWEHLLFIRVLKLATPPSKKTDSN